MLKIGTKNINNIYIGSKNVERVYCGSDIIWQKEQPLPYDAEVSYLQADGTQLIDTGMKTSGGDSALNRGYQVEIEYRYTSRPGNDTWVFGYWNTIPSIRLYLIGYYNGYRCGAGPDTSSYWANINYDSNFHVASIKNDGAYFDGIRLKPTDISGIGAHGAHGLWLFQSEHVERGGTRQVKYCKMWTIEGELVRDFIPVRFTNENDISEGAMYDRVSKQLFRNIRYGRFVIGPDKNI